MTDVRWVRHTLLRQQILDPLGAPDEFFDDSRPSDERDRMLIDALVVAAADATSRKLICDASEGWQKNLNDQSKADALWTLIAASANLRDWRPIDESFPDQQDFRQWMTTLDGVLDPRRFERTDWEWKDATEPEAFASSLRKLFDLFGALLRGPQEKSWAKYFTWFAPR